MHWMVIVAASSAADLIGAGLSWTCVNDTVMGGVSQSEARLEDGALSFAGELSLEQNGGFTSVRSLPGDLDLAGVTGFRLRMVGDGRTYDFTARRSDVPIRGGSYRVPIETVAGEEIVVEVGLTSFSATSFGRPLSGAPSLAAAPERIESIGFLLADKQPGAFSLEVRAIEPLTEPLPEPVAVSDQTGVVTTFIRAIERGVPVFNRGEPAVCAAIYQTAVESALLMAGSALSDADRAVLTAALQVAASQGAVEAAWTLRRAMDTVLAGL